MKAMLAGFAVMILVAIGGYVTLHEIGFESADKFSSESVRLD